MNKLEKKFNDELDFYKDRLDSKDRQNIAFAFMEIAEKHYDLYDDLIADRDYAIKELKEKIKEQDKEIVEYLQEPDKLLMKIDKLQKENNELKKDCDDFRKDMQNQDDYTEQLKKQIENIKYLDRKEVEKAINDNIIEPVIEIDEDGNKTQLGKELNHKNCIEAICQLIIPEEGVVIFEGPITLGGDNGLTKYAGKKGKLIFIEDKEK